MLKNKKLGLIFSVLVVLLVVIVLVYITKNNKKEISIPAEQQAQVGEEQKTNMDNTQSDNTQKENTQAAQNEPVAKDVNGVKITVLKEGTGDKVAKNGDNVAMGYVGFLTDETVFDSNVDPKTGQITPFNFTLGSGQVIKGWDIGVAGMKVGEQRKLEIPAELAYGERGAGAAIPPNATLIFMVQLIAIK